MMKKQLLRRLTALAVSLLTLWTAILASDREAVIRNRASQLSSFYTALLRWELGDYFGTDLLSAVNVLALRQSPLLMSQRHNIVSLLTQAMDAPGDDPSPAPPAEEPAPPAADLYAVRFDDLSFAENGVPSQTTAPTTTKGYTVIDGVYIKNTSSRQISTEDFTPLSYTGQLAQEGPQVLILHSHATEAYTMPPGQEYEASGTYRTHDTSCNVVRIGDEVASVLSSYGISVLHDRTLHDAASYNDAYDSSYASIQQYLAKYPSISYVLDIHRDAIQDTDGNQYKLVTREDPRVAQCCLVMGVAHDNWQENLRLSIAVQQELNTALPTLMRPVVARGYRYNQHLCAGSLLVEIGAAGNSLDEALMGARYFAAGFAETILCDE